MSQSSFNAAIQAALLEEVGANVGNRVYHLEAPDDAAFPHVVHAIVVDDVVRHFVDDSDVDMNVQIDLYGGDDAGMAALQAVNTALFAGVNRKTLTVAGYNDAEIFCTLRGEEIEEDDVLRIRTEWRILAS